MNTAVTPIAGRNVTVMGLGLFGGGTGAARWALRQGAIVTVTDLRSADVLADSAASLRAEPGAERLSFALGSHGEREFRDADLVIVNPAVPPASPWLRIAREAGTEITTATALLLERLRCRVVAITGTHGKSSTARFACDLIRAASPPASRVLLGGNIGGSLLDETIALGPGDVVVLELSSYQLEHLANLESALTVDVAAITNIGVDHLERHGSLEAYRGAKLALLDLVPSGGTAILPFRGVDRESVERVGRTHLTHGAGGDIAVGTDDVVRLAAPPRATVALGDASALQVPGTFQRDNLAVALAAAHALGLDPGRLARAVPTLRGLPHRMESLGTFEIPRAQRQVEVVDNGVSTTPESTLAVVAALSAEARGAGARILVAGGQAKRGVDDASLAERLAQDGWTLVPFGAAAERLATAGRAAGAKVVGLDDGEWPGSAEEAAAVAFHVAGQAPLESGDPAGAPEDPLPIVLFSPACASFDRYPNFEARAMAFRGAVEALSGTRQSTERSNSVY